MRLRLLLPFLLLLSTPGHAAMRWQEHPEWAAEFTSRGVTGSVLVYDEQADNWRVFDRARAETRFIPASTFKVFNALVALDTAAVKDEYEVIRWDGVKRSFEHWNRDHSLASAMKFSVVWFYQEMARRAGQARMQAWIDRVGYGNGDLGGGVDRFWLSGDLRISAREQIDFLRRLARNELPFTPRAQEAVRRITILESAPDFVLHGKTGWAPRGDTARKDDLGWFVGWVERAGRRWFFALNMDIRTAADASLREPIARAVLTRSGALPPSAP